MPAVKVGVSCTAPRITPEEEEAELAALTSEEKQAIEDDIFGYHHRRGCRDIQIVKDDKMNKLDGHNSISGSSDGEDVSSTDFSCSAFSSELANATSTTKDNKNCDQHRQHCVKEDNNGIYIELQQAIDEMSALEKSAYQYVLEKNPNVIESDSDIDTYLQLSNYNIKDTAIRLTTYWKIRKQVFGIDKYYHSLSELLLSGDACAVIEKWKKCGVFQVLPPDNVGRPVIFFDRMSIDNSNMKREEITQCLLYALHLLHTKNNIDSNSNNNDDKHHKQNNILGYVFMVHCQGYDFYEQFDRKLMILVHGVVESGPLHCMVQHPCCGPGRKNRFVLVLPVLKFIIGRRLRLRTVMHMGTKEEMAYDLSKYGFKKEHLTNIVGGYRTLDDHVQWLDHHIESFILQQS